MNKSAFSFLICCMIMLASLNLYAQSDPPVINGIQPCGGAEIVQPVSPPPGQIPSSTKPPDDKKDPCKCEFKGETPTQDCIDDSRQCQQSKIDQPFEFTECEFKKFEGGTSWGHTIGESTIPIENNQLGVAASCGVVLKKTQYPGYCDGECEPKLWGRETHEVLACGVCWEEAEPNGSGGHNITKLTCTPTSRRKRTPDELPNIANMCNWQDVEGQDGLQIIQDCDVNKEGKCYGTCQYNKVLRNSCKDNNIQVLDWGECKNCKPQGPITGISTTQGH